MMRTPLTCQTQFEIHGPAKNPRYWHIPDLLRFMLPQTPFKTDVVFEGL